VAIYVIAQSYEDDDHDLALEIYFEGPDDLPPERVSAVVLEFLSTGEIPDGWTFDGVFWDHGRGDNGGTPEDVLAFGDFLRAEGFEVHDLGALPGGFEVRGELDEDDDLEEREEE
jgi:hypothetical protein